MITRLHSNARKLWWHDIQWSMRPQETDDYHIVHHELLELMRSQRMCFAASFSRPSLVIPFVTVCELCWWDAHLSLYSLRRHRLVGIGISILGYPYPYGAVVSVNRGPAAPTVSLRFVCGFILMNIIMLFPYIHVFRCILYFLPVSFAVCAFFSTPSLSCNIKYISPWTCMSQHLQAHCIYPISIIYSSILTNYRPLNLHRQCLSSVGYPSETHLKL